MPALPKKKEEAPVTATKTSKKKKKGAFGFMDGVVDEVASLGRAVTKAFGKGGGHEEPKAAEAAAAAPSAPEIETLEIVTTDSILFSTSSKFLGDTTCP